MSEIYKKNEYETNESVAKAVLVLMGFILIIGVFCWTGIFDIYSYMINSLLVASIIPLVLPTILVYVFHVNKPWVKYLIIFLLAFEVGLCYVIFTFQAIIVFLVPVIIATFYLDEKKLYFAIVISGVVILISHFITGFYLFQPHIEPFIGMKPIMLYGALPRLLQFLLCSVMLILLCKRFSVFMDSCYSLIHKENDKKDNNTELDKILANLTEREQEIFMLIVKGCTNTQIADKCCLSLGTVKNYVSLIYDKVGCRERTNLILKYSQYYKEYDQSNT